jgi:hypothetical protein
MKNKITDLNNHLFAQLERLGDEDLKGDALEAECERAEAIAKISEQLIRSANVSLNAARLVGEYGGNVRDGLPLLEQPRRASGSSEE